MILFGWGKRTTKDYGDTYPINCPNCGNQSFARLVNYKTWFTLFFVPVIPYESKHLLLCKVCNRGVELTGEKINNAKQLSEKTKLYLNQEIEKEEYEKILEQAKIFN